MRLSIFNAAKAMVKEERRKESAPNGGRSPVSLYEAKPAIRKELEREEWLKLERSTSSV